MRGEGRAASGDGMISINHRGVRCSYLNPYRNSAHPATERWTVAPRLSA